MKKIVQFQISIGELGYIAEAVGVPIFTQAKSLDELMKNIREASELYFEDEDLSENGFSAKPSLLVNFELPDYAQA